MMNERARKISCLESLRKILRPDQGAAARALCSWASPSIQYSILRKTISMRSVWGQVQPHHSRPKAVVKTMIPMKKMSIATAKMKVS